MKKKRGWYTMTYQELVSLSKEQALAVRQAEACLRRSPRAQALLRKEAENLTAPQGSGGILADMEELRGLYEGNAHLHALLTLLSQVPWLRAEYERRGLPKSVLRATLLDIPIWMEACREKTGAYGLIEYSWLVHTFRLKLFRIGRLEFMRGAGTMPAHVFKAADGRLIALAPEGMRYAPEGIADGANGIFSPEAWTARYDEDADQIRGHVISTDGRAAREIETFPAQDLRRVYRPGDQVLEVHIPSGEPLAPEKAFGAMRAAPGFFRAHFSHDDMHLFTCESWLMDGALREAFPGGNIGAFQDLFARVPFAGDDRQTIERVFGFNAQSVPQTPQGNRLQRGIIDLYRRGGRCCEAYGYRTVGAYI